MPNLPAWFLARLVHEFLEVDADDLSVSLTRGVAHLQHVSLRELGDEQMVITGTVESIKFSWRWGGLMSLADLRDVKIEVSGLDLTITMLTPPPSPQRAQHTCIRTRACPLRCWMRHTWLYLALHPPTARLCSHRVESLCSLQHKLYDIACISARRPNQR